VTTYEAQDRDVLPFQAGFKPSEGSVPKPSRVFACVGKGLRGAITEFRYGLEANIGLEMDYDTPIMHAWALSPAFDSEDEGAYLFLLSMGDRSAVLRLSGDAREIVELDDQSTKLDLRYRTITAAAHAGQNIIQVTERSIVVVCGDLV
jgi:hypothetical protein